MTDLSQMWNSNILSTDAIHYFEMYIYVKMTLHGTNNLPCSRLSVSKDVKKSGQAMSRVFLSRFPLVTDPARRWSCSSLIPLVADPARHWSCSSLIPLIPDPAHHWSCSSLALLVGFRLPASIIQVTILVSVLILFPIFFFQTGMPQLYISKLWTYPSWRNFLLTVLSWPGYLPRTSKIQVCYSTCTVCTTALQTVES